MQREEVEKFIVGGGMSEVIVHLRQAGGRAG